MSSYIVVRFRFEGIHNYPLAPAGVLFLKDKHRHVFHVEAKIQVFHDDRELEFILVKRLLESNMICKQYDLGSMSCETIAKAFISQLQFVYGYSRNIFIRVFEDGENGAEVEYRGSDPNLS
jgi:hypothetical protein